MTEEQWNPPLTKGEAQSRAQHALYLEGQGVELEEAMRRGDELIAIHRAFGQETPFKEPKNEAPGSDLCGNW